MTAPETPRAAKITIAQPNVSLSFIGESFKMTASVTDQNGQPFNGIVSWASDDQAIVRVDAQGSLTAVANGATTVRALSGSVTATATVTVRQVAIGVGIVSGDGQSGVVGTALAAPLVVEAHDAGGTGVADAQVTVTIATGNGAVSDTSMTSGGDGRAQMIWTLGTAAGTQRLTVDVVGGTAPSVDFTATAQASAATGLQKTGGDAQVGPIERALPDSLVVTVVDEFGNGVPGQTVTFAVTGGGGQVDPATVVTDAGGVARTIWTMGSVVGAAQASASVAGISSVIFTATASEALPAAPDLIPNGITLTPFNPTSLQTVEVVVRVANQGDLATPGGFQADLLVDGVRVATASGSALAIGATTEVSFTAGPLATGTHIFKVVVDPASAVTESDETNNTAQRSTTVQAATAVVAGSPIAGIAGAEGVEMLFALEVGAGESGTLEISLSGGTGDVDMYVQRGDRPANRDDYLCRSGGPSTEESCVFNDAQPGTYHILLFAFSDFSGTTLLATTGGQTIPYEIELVFLTHGTPSQDSAFQAAADRWERIIRDDLVEVDFATNPVPKNQCADGQDPFTGKIDDIRIYVNITDIDGPFGTLAQAGPCVVRGLSDLPIIGSMEFDSEDLIRLESEDQMIPVVLHEMGHVLGIGTLWDRFGLIRNPSLPSNRGADTHFVGPLAIEAFDDAGGTTYTGGAKVPVENLAGEGSADSHWREAVLGFELMTPNLNGGITNPLSAISIQSLADMGYRVNVSEADAYSRVFGAQARAPSRAPVVDLRGDVRTGPILVVDPKGRVLEVIRR
jgi:CARDB/Bacterial pre-peptidase C-terminal domain/Leishmanolysin/Bacterial Ig-like domain (group 2)